MKYLVEKVKEVGISYMVPKKGERVRFMPHGDGTILTKIVTDVVELAPSVYLFRTESGNHYIVQVVTMQ